jgi:hypothetical protein
MSAPVDLSSPDIVLDSTDLYKDVSGDLSICAPMDLPAPVDTVGMVLNRTDLYRNISGDLSICAGTSLAISAQGPIPAVTGGSPVGFLVAGCSINSIILTVDRTTLWRIVLHRWSWPTWITIIALTWGHHSQFQRFRLWSSLQTWNSQAIPYQWYLFHILDLSYLTVV